ncbi:hypothetical protein COLINT_02338 [Collinsella intestinalis DSM 13280]|uniref:Uncharacterized protein n=1 Tax=Collinsella intestinalis DSM 13280 TaxID=521003 RepID=C4F8G6_9ACTN|nr:hypothetical protein COLINT_02338 [Collinsella intestinalis DSM 13280]
METPRPPLAIAPPFVGSDGIGGVRYPPIAQRYAGGNRLYRPGRAFEVGGGASPPMPF